MNKYKVDREREVVSGGVVDCKQVDKDLQEHSDEFIKLYETTWQNLMEDEVQLHESVFVRLVINSNQKRNINLYFLFFIIGCKCKL